MIEIRRALPRWFSRSPLPAARTRTNYAGGTGGNGGGAGMGGMRADAAARLAVPGTAGASGGMPRYGWRRPPGAVRSGAPVAAAAPAALVAAARVAFISAQYPRDVGIAADPRVLFASDFENGPHRAGPATRTNADHITVLTDTMLAHAGSRFLRAQVTRAAARRHREHLGPTRNTTSPRASPRSIGGSGARFVGPDRVAAPLGPRRRRDTELSVRRAGQHRAARQPGVLVRPRREARARRSRSTPTGTRCARAAATTAAPRRAARAIRAPPTTTATTSTRPARASGERPLVLPGDPRQGERRRPVRWRADALEGRRAGRRIQARHAAGPLAARQLL